MDLEKQKTYNQAEEAKGAIKIISLREGFAYLNKKFKSEKDFDKNIINKIPFLIDKMYGYKVVNIQQQKVFDLTNHGYYKIIVDFFVETKEGKSFIIESKNPIQEKSETILAIGQIMSYDFIVSKIPIDCQVILATSVFDFKYLEFMAHYNLKFDLILNNENQVAFWINEWK